MLEIKGLKKALGSLEVLKGVDLKVKQGDVVLEYQTALAVKAEDDYSRIEKSKKNVCA